MARNLTFSTGEFYHLYNRGVDRRTVFENESDYRRFGLLLYLANSKLPLRFDQLPNWKGETSPELIESVFESDRGGPLVAIGAYCCMPNHFHILVREVSDKGISAFMQKLATAYTMYFNGSRKRTGALFQGPFKARLANKDTYLRYLFSYIHLNPVKIIDAKWKENGIKDLKKCEQFLLSYPYSSYLDYAKVNRVFAKILQPKEFPEYFQTRREVQHHVKDWLTYRLEEIP